MRLIHCIITFHESSEQHNGDEFCHRTECNTAPNIKNENNNITIAGLVGKEMNHGKQQKNSGTEISLHKSSYTDPYCYLVAHHAVYYLIFIHSL